MKKEEQQIKELFERWYNNTITAAELEELIGLLRTNALEQDVLPLLERAWENQARQKVFTDEETDAMVNGIIEKYPGDQQGEAPVRRLGARRWYWAAATALLVLGASAYLLLRRAPAPGVSLAQQAEYFRPGANRAVLTLTDGSTITLDSAANGTLIQQGATQVVKLGSGQLAYNTTGAPQQGGPSYNLLSTPRGGQYEVILPDGSRVWLNAASSLRYPVKFDSDRRVVELTGEAYFEVSGKAGNNGQAPFIVKTAAQQVYVLGTRFNINCYGEEPSVSTTLLEGKVKVAAAGGQNTILLPAQQSTVNKTGYALNVTHTDPADAIAWRNGYFQFSDANIYAVMRQLSRWYNFEADYGAGITTNIRLSGKISRSQPFSQVLQMLKYYGLNFQINGNVVTVSAAKA